MSSNTEWDSFSCKSLHVTINIGNNCFHLFDSHSKAWQLPPQKDGGGNNFFALGGASLRRTLVGEGYLGRECCFLVLGGGSSQV